MSIVKHIAMLLLVSTAVLSCTADMSFNYSDSKTLVISGMASDSGSKLPLEDIKITLDAAESVNGLKRNQVKVTVYTDNIGSYTITAQGFHDTVSCIISAEDMNSVYKGSSQEINISWSGPSYDRNTDTFYVNDCNFYLEKAGK